MRLPIDGSQPLRRHLRIDLGARKAGVSEYFLNDPKVGATVEQVCRGGVPEGVRTARPGSGHTFEHVSCNPVDRACAEISPTCTKKQRPPGIL